MIIPDDHAHCVYEFTITGLADPISTTMGHYTGDVGISSPEDVANRAFDCMALSYLTILPASATLTGVTAYQRVGADLLVGLSDRAPVAGTGFANPAPPNVCTLVRKNTGFAGRKFRGRMFLPSVAETQIDAAGIIAGSLVTDVTAEGDDFLAALADDGIIGYAIPARLLHSDATAPTAITSLVCDPKVGTQRRRMR